MKETRVLIDLGLLCLLFSDALGATDNPPEIIGRDHIQLKAHLGRTFDLKCKAKTNFRKDLTMIYWLVNGSFPESLGTSRISETEFISSDGTIQRNLKVRNVTTEDMGSTFVCVVMNPEGVAKKHFTLQSPFRKPAT